MNYGKLNMTDIANGEGVRVSLFVSGCDIHCEGCFNKVAWDYSYGEEFTPETLMLILDRLKEDYISGLSILGGEPLSVLNIGIVTLICAAVKMWYPNKTIWLYTGYDFDDMHDEPVMRFVDVVVDGQFEIDKKNISLAFRGSSNQRLIDVKKSLVSDKVVLYEMEK